MALENKCLYQHFGQVCNSGAAILCLCRVQCATLDPDPGSESCERKKEECLPDRIKTIGFEKLFLDWVCQVPVKMHKKYARFCRFC